MSVTDMRDVDEVERYRAPALDKGLDILELLAATEAGLSQAEIAKSLERSPGEIYRMLERLVRRGYVWRTAEDRYELTLKLFELAHARPPMRRLVRQALPAMQRYAREAEQSCHLVIYDRNVLVVVAQVDAPGYWGVAIRVGSRIGMINTGSGHVFLAYATPEERQLMLEGAGPGAPEPRPHGFEQRLEAVRQDGFEQMPSQQIQGVTNLSVPVLGPLGTVLAALTCPFIERLDRQDATGVDKALRLLRAAAEEISNHNRAATEEA